ncbi:hypothetical protein NC653_010049 [Populus alba x Populus x berolinensis]|uniref:Uncharacterized protein n=1 Tax=Populus alba x Populus x berolinensis TaxID=444605 RepID=A0AAD6W5X3_9ROSI|nr:hypothetical protein NC653_010049 [Populus alba x Populus x berolinensis]
MKRKKWSELEEQTLLSKYSDLLTSGTLSKLKTREKKFRPIADHVNTIHHLQDPIGYPFKWSWRDYKEVFGDVELEVKSKKSSGSGDSDFVSRICGDLGFGIDSEDYLEEDDQEEEDGEEEEDVNGDGGNDNVGGGEEDGEFRGEKGNGEMGIGRKEKMKKGLGGNRRLGLLGAQVMDLRDVVLRREEKRREREFNGEKCVLESEKRRRELGVSERHVAE